MSTGLQDGPMDRIFRDLNRLKWMVSANTALLLVILYLV
jgi:hypothetical protein